MKFCYVGKKWSSAVCVFLWFKHGLKVVSVILLACLMRGWRITPVTEGHLLSMSAPRNTQNTKRCPNRLDGSSGDLHVLRARAQEDLIEQTKKLTADSSTTAAGWSANLAGHTQMIPSEGKGTTIITKPPINIDSVSTSERNVWVERYTFWHPGRPHRCT